MLGNDTDPDGDPIDVVLATDPAHGTTVVNGDNTITYTPDLNWTGTDTYTYEITDNNGGFATATVTITVTPVNDPPVANDDLAVTDEDTPVTVPVLADDSDVDGPLDPASVTVTSAPTDGTTSVNADGTITYTPNPGFWGTDSFDYQVCDLDPTPLCDTATVQVTVNSVNDPPVAVDDADTTPEDTPITMTVLGNDTDPDGDPIDVVLATDPAHGTTVVNGDNTITYTPDLNWTGTDTYTYEITDNNGGFATATVTITVTPVNDPPVANDDLYSTSEDTPLIVPLPGLLTNDTDPENDTLTITLNTQPANGTVTVNPDGSFTYTPNPNWTGTDTFDYTISDGNGETDTATVTVDVTPVADTPTAVDDVYSTPEDTPLTVPAPGVLGNDTDVENDPLTVGLYTQPAHGSVTVNPDGSFTYTPDLNWTGTDTYTYEACDPLCDTATVTITVTPVNDPPVANDDLAVTDEDTPVTVPVLADDSDVDGPLDPASVTVTSAPTDGTTSVNADGTITYTPNPGFWGTDSFDYQVCDLDPTPLCDTATVSVTVNSVNDPPVAVDDADTTPEDTPITMTVLGNDTDPDGDPIDVVLATDPAHGTTVVNGDNTITYTPDLNWTGTDTYTYEITDNNGGFATATVTITVTPVNDPPVANDDLAVTDEDTPVTVPVLADDSDVDGPLDPASVTVTSAPTDGTTSVNADGTITYTPNPGFWGTDSFDYQVCDLDPTPLCDTATVQVTVNSVNDPPVAVDDADTTPEDTPITMTVLGNDTDPDGDPIDVVLATDPAHGTTVVNGDNTITYTPDLNWTGTDTYTYEITDNNGGFATATVTITVTPVNDPPVANDDLAVTDEDTPVTVPVLADDSDVDGPLDPASVTVTSAPTDGTTSVNADGTITYTPNPGFWGTDSFDYQVCDTDPTPLCDTATVSVTVNSVNDPPVAVDDADTTPEDTPITMTVLGNDTDPDGDPIDVVLATDPAHGTTVVNGDNTITYTPDLNWTGTDTYTYEITDNNGGFDTATVTITVTPVNDPPVANDDLYSTSEDTPLIVPLPGLLTNDTDPENDTLTITLNTQPANGTVTVNPDGSFTYTPNPNWTGTDTFDLPGLRQRQSG